MIREFSLLTLAVLTLSGCVTPSREGDGHAQEQHTGLYILAGQSNMSGLGRLDALTPAERTMDPAIRLYGNDGRWKPALDPLDDATGQIDDISIDRHAGVGPGLFFARAIHRMQERAVGLLPCAKGGSAIDLWAPATGRDTLYGSCLARIAETGTAPAGILWYQGEADTRRLDLAHGWQAKFVTMVGAMRRDLGQPRLPVVLVELSDPDTTPRIVARRPGWDVVQAAQRDLRLDCVATVSATGLAQNRDRLHIATAGHRILGQRIAKAMAALQDGGCHGG